MIMIIMMMMMTTPIIFITILMTTIITFHKCTSVFVGGDMSLDSLVASNTHHASCQLGSSDSSPLLSPPAKPQPLQTRRPTIRGEAPATPRWSLPRSETQKQLKGIRDTPTREADDLRTHLKAQINQAAAVCSVICKVPLQPGCLFYFAHVGAV